MEDKFMKAKEPRKKMFQEKEGPASVAQSVVCKTKAESQVPTTV